jgi:hypothetical protein
MVTVEDKVAGFGVQEKTGSSAGALGFLNPEP